MSGGDWQVYCPLPANCWRDSPDVGTIEEYAIEVGPG